MSIRVKSKPISCPLTPRHPVAENREEKEGSPEGVDNPESHRGFALRPFRPMVWHRSVSMFSLRFSTVFEIEEDEEEELGV